MLNPAVNRMLTRHLPQLAEGNLGWVMQSELGLYPTAESKQKQAEFQEITPELWELIDQLQAQGR